MRRLFPIGSLLAAITALTPAVALAQDQAAGGGGDDTASQSVFQMFFMSDDPVGMGIIWLLLIMSMFTIGYIIKLVIQYRKPMVVPPETREQIESLIAEKKYRDAIEYAQSDDSYLGRVTSSALNEAANGFSAMERAVEEAGDAETTRYLRPVEYLNVVGNISPMMGLFGTVYGMIRAFQKLVEAGGNPDPTQLAAGISTALVTTLWGLVVAIPALAGYALIRNKIDALTSEGLLEAEEMIAAFKPGKKGGGGGSGGGGGGGQQRPRATPKPEGGE